MRLFVTLCTVLLSIPAATADTPSTAKPDPLAAVAWLAGDWRGIGEGQPGVSAAERHIERDINGRFLKVEARSVYPKQEKNPKGEIHVSLDLWSYDRRRAVLVLRQFDSLGFVTTYVQDKTASSTDRLVLNAEHLENVPPGTKARYTYTFRAPDEYQELFELDFDGHGLKTYVAGKYLRLP